MIFHDKILLSTKGFCDICNITEEVQKIVGKSKIKNGIVLVFVIGSTAGITTIEYEPNLIRDLQEFFEKIIPQNESYHHDETWGDNNGFSHLRAALLGPSLSLPLTDGKLQLGDWQQIVFIDFDNRPRNRSIFVQIMGEE
jgi:secondary thiamine-phosphate synthase enzyme